MLLFFTTFDFAYNGVFSDDQSVLAKTSNLLSKMTVLSRILHTDTVSFWAEDTEEHSLVWLSPIPINTILNVS